MTEKYMAVKVAAVGIVGFITAKFGWLGWLILLYVACVLVDMITGWCKAIKSGTWSSQVARNGLWHKAGAIFAVGVAAGADFLVSLAVENVAGLSVEFKGAFLPIVLVWYILTEMGSIIENAGELGAPIPKFLVKCISVLKNAAEKAGDVTAGEDLNVKK